MNAPRPNIVFIVADDLGYADLGCYGGRYPVSPRLDALASNGIRFSEGYSNSPVCSPTRFALMTGSYQYRLRGAAEEPISSKSKGSTTLGLPQSQATMPSRLKKAGYNTSLIGKWHLGYPPAFGPLKSGYDEFFGPMSGGVDYFTHRDTSGNADLWAGETASGEEGYLTDLLSKKAVEYVHRKADEARDGKPFLLSLHYTAPHWPWETRDDEEIAQRLEHQSLFHHHGGNIHTYRRMIQHMDEGIGWLVDALTSEGILEDTLIIFTSDNGGERFSDNWPLVGGKLDLTEGGIRVPWIAHWPAAIKPGRESTQHCLTMDWSATVLDAVGVYPEAGDASGAIDGVSLLRVLTQGTESFDRPMYWRMKYRGQRAMRLGRWKYLRVDEVDYLFDLSQDERERANQAEIQPERMQSMRKAWEAWNETMPGIPADATVLPGYSTRDMPAR